MTGMGGLEPPVRSLRKVTRMPDGLEDIKLKKSCLLWVVRMNEMLLNLYAVGILDA